MAGKPKYPPRKRYSFLLTAETESLMKQLMAKATFERNDGTMSQSAALDFMIWKLADHEGLIKDGPQAVAQ